jgi:DNA-binding response OmpR family regulator
VQAGGALVITGIEVMLPVMSRAELIIEARSPCPDLPVCCMTAYNPVVDPELESVLIISKPFPLRKLIDVVRQVLNRRRQQGTHAGTPFIGHFVPENQICEHT